MRSSLVIAILCVIAAVLLLVEMAEGGTWTTDERSLYHVGVGGAAGALLDVGLVQSGANLNRTERVLISGSLVTLAAAGKEYGMDSTPDYADLLYGAGAGFVCAYLADKGQEKWAAFVVADQDVVVVGIAGKLP